MNDFPSRSIGRHLQLAARAHKARTAEAIQDMGLFPGQEQVLLALLGDREQTVGQLATLLFVRPPTISKTLQRLAQQGLIIRKDDDSDARKSLVSMTRQGSKLASELADRLIKVEDRISDVLDQKDQRRLRKSLKKITQSLGGAKSPDEI